MGSLLRPDHYDRIASTDLDSPWAGAPDPSVVDHLSRLLQRIPPCWAEPVYLHRIQGVIQEEIGRRLGICQEGVVYRIQQGIERMKWVSENLPDLLPGEVHDLLIGKLERVEVSEAASMYWIEHRIGILGPHGQKGQSRTWYLLFGPRGLCRRRRDDPDLGPIVRGIEAIRALRPPSGRHSRQPRRS